MTVASVSRKKGAQPTPTAIIKHPKSFLKKMERVLKGMQISTEANIKGYEQSLQETSDDHDEEGAHATKEWIEKLLGREGRNLNRIREALVSINNETYGICQETGELIDTARLEAMPTATTKIIR